MMEGLDLQRGGGTPPPPRALAMPADEMPPALTTYYPDVDAWLNEWLLVTVLVHDAHSPRNSGVYWCPKWFLHPEVVARLNGLWRAWETARLTDGDAPLNWWRDHFDVHWPSLTSSRGPMGRCSAERHEPGEILPVARRTEFTVDNYVIEMDPPAWATAGDLEESTEDDDAALATVDQPLDEPGSLASASDPAPSEVDELSGPRPVAPPPPPWLPTTPHAGGQTPWGPRS